MSAIKKITPQIRTMQVSDLSEILRIERASYDYPWSEGIFRDCLRAGYTCVVLCVGDHIGGYGIFQFVAGEVHVLNLCIAPSQRRMGYAHQLLNDLFHAMKNRGDDTVYLEVRSSNKVARDLYSSEGFNEVGIRKGYYRTLKANKSAMQNNDKEDALIMARYAG